MFAELLLISELLVAIALPDPHVPEQSYTVIELPAAGAVGNVIVLAPLTAYILLIAAVKLAHLIESHLGMPNARAAPVALYHLP